MPGPRELIEPHPGDKRYQQRKKDGSFGPADNMTKSLRQDCEAQGEDNREGGIRRRRRPEETLEIASGFGCVDGWVRPGHDGA